MLAHGTGGINVDGCRVEGPKGWPDSKQYSNGIAWGDNKEAVYTQDNSENPSKNIGRWPANLIHNGDPEVLELFPESGITKPARTGIRGGKSLFGEIGMGSPDKLGTWPADMGGSAARFFYCAKASKADREDGLAHMPTATASEMTGGRKEGSAGLNDPRAGAGRTNGGRNTHPTVKPTALMAYLCRLVTPPGGVVLDPFMGSGSTGRGAMLGGFRFIGIEMDPYFTLLSQCRILRVRQNPTQEIEV